MSESYTVGGDTLYKCDDPTWAGQTFRPVEDHILEYIDLEMRGPLLIPEPTILVFFASVYHKPWGDYISRNRFIVEQKCGILTIGRIRFSMTPTLLKAGDYYVIVVQHFPDIGGFSAYWQYDSGGSTYPRGHRISTPDAGITWNLHIGQDHIFAEFGLPPLPKPEPPPPIPNFAVLDFQRYCTPEGTRIRIPTSVPCQLTCYWTNIPPLKHFKSRITRGLTVPWHTYFSFVLYRVIEQNEPSDSLYHTFNLIPWPVCETRWLTFRGEVDTIESPSVGPIFKCHRSEVTLPVKFQHYEDYLDRHATIYENVWHAQTFTPQQHHILAYVVLRLARSIYTWPRLYIEIRPVQNDMPTDLILASGSVSASQLKQHLDNSWVTINVGDIYLTPGTKYAIVAHSDASRVAWLFWYGHYPGGGYEGGIASISTDGGHTWRTIEGSDGLFQEWGYPLCPE